MVGTFWDTVYNSLHTRADVDRLYVPKKEGGRGLAKIQDSMNMKEHSLSRYVDTSEKELLKATNEANVQSDWNLRETDT